MIMDEFSPFSRKYTVAVDGLQYEFRVGDSRCSACPLTGDKCHGNGYKCKGGRFYKVKTVKTEGGE